MWQELWAYETVTEGPWSTPLALVALAIVLVLATWTVASLTLSAPGALPLAGPRSAEETAYRRYAYGQISRFDLEQTVRDLWGTALAW